MGVNLWHRLKSEYLSLLSEQAMPQIHTQTPRNHHQNLLPHSRSGLNRPQVLDYEIGKIREQAIDTCLVDEYLQ